jgi:hypothetical protein
MAAQKLFGYSQAMHSFSMGFTAVRMPPVPGGPVGFIKILPAAHQFLTRKK